MSNDYINDTSLHDDISELIELVRKETLADLRDELKAEIVLVDDEIFNAVHEEDTTELEAQKKYIKMFIKSLESRLK